jgi:hypothetical protein
VVPIRPTASGGIQDGRPSRSTAGLCLRVFACSLEPEENEGDRIASPCNRHIFTSTSGTPWVEAVSSAGFAYAEFQDKEKGTLAPGMLADIALLPRTP